MNDSVTLHNNFLYNVVIAVVVTVLEAVAVVALTSGPSMVQCTTPPHYVTTHNVM